MPNFLSGHRKDPRPFFTHIKRQNKIHIKMHGETHGHYTHVPHFVLTSAHTFLGTIILTIHTLLRSIEQLYSQCTPVFCHYWCNVILIVQHVTHIYNILYKELFPMVVVVDIPFSCDRIGKCSVNKSLLPQRVY